MRNSPSTKPEGSMDLHVALSSTLPDGFYLNPDVVGYFQDDSHTNGNMVGLSLLGCAHIAQYGIPNLFTNDPMFAGDTLSRGDRIYRDLLNAWPILAVRLRYIPGIMRELKGVSRVATKDWSLFHAIAHIGRPIIPVLKDLEI